MFGRKDHRELFAAVAIEGYLQRLEDLQPFAGDVTQDDIAIEVAPVSLIDLKLSISTSARANGW